MPVWFFIRSISTTFILKSRIKLEWSGFFIEDENKKNLNSIIQKIIEAFVQKDSHCVEICTKNI
jgi:hypothetical protein